MNLEDTDFSEWLNLTSERRDELMAYAKTRLPIDATESVGGMDELIQNEADSLALLADARSFLIQHEAQAVLEARCKHKDLSAPERRIMVKYAIRDMQRLVDGLHVIASTLGNKRFALMNQRRSGP